MHTIKRLPTFFISHGGGPWPWMPGMSEGAYAKLADSLRRIPLEIGAKPRAILMVSAHWEASAFTIQTHPNPSMIYDYHGFPAHTYQIRYPSQGDPTLATRVVELLHKTNLPVATDARRGYDHGMYAPMAIAYPNADMPTVQLSLLASLNPQIHLELGRALAPLREEGIVLIGSGLSYHNLRAFGPEAQHDSMAFDKWLHNTMQLTGAERTDALLHWENAPAARRAHPRAEHLIPLMVAVGAAEHETAKVIYHEENFMGGVAASSFRFGSPV